jgi:hypothetical protein
MRMLIAAAALLLAACSPAGAPGKGDSPAAKGAAQPAGPADPIGFTHPAGASLFGYYIPTTDTKSGDWQLTSFSIGDEDAFKEWEGGRHSATYAPVMLEFDNMASPMGTNELGAEYHTISERILPTAYAIGSDGKVDFAGTGAKLGKVTFHGQLDMAALQTATREDAAGDEVVMHGTLTVGGKSFNDVAFSYFAGD